MQVLKELFTSDAALMSVAGIAFMLGMGVFFIRYFLKHIREDGARQSSRSRPTGDRPWPEGLEAVESGES